MSTVHSLEDTALPILKRLQKQRDVERLWKQHFPLLAKIKKLSGFVGSQMDVPLDIGGSSRSRSFAVAQANSFLGEYAKYSLTRKKDYSEGLIDAETMAAQSNDTGAWLRATKRKLMDTHLALRTQSAHSIYRGSSGSMGRIASVTDLEGGTNNVLVLENRTDVMNFPAGTSLSFSVTDGGGAGVLAMSQKIYVQKVSLQNGYIYLSTTQTGTASPANYATILTGEAETEYIFHEGDYDASYNGLADWIPLVEPDSSDNFLGINRSGRGVIERLAGHRLNDTNMSYSDMLQELSMLTTYTGGMAKTAVISPTQFLQFSRQMNINVTQTAGGSAVSGFSSLPVHTPNGVIEVFADPACPSDRMYLLDLSTWCFHHLKEFPHLVNDDGLRTLRVAAADQIAFRYRSWGNLACYKPGANAVAALPAIS